MKKEALFACLTLLLAVAGRGQTQLGLRLDNMAGVNSIWQNPAAPVSFPFSWDVNLIEGAQFLSNNYFYFKDARLLELLSGKSRELVRAGKMAEPGAPAAHNPLFYDFFDDGRRRGLLELTSVMGPSFLVRLNDRHQLGLMTRSRTIGNARNVDTDFSYYPYYDRPFYEAFQVDPFRLNLLSALEVGLNYAIYLPMDGGTLALGLTVKSLLGLEGGFVTSRSTFELTKLPGDSLSSGPFAFDFGYTNSNLTDKGFSPQINGWGYGLDLGLVYAAGGETPDLYRWKFSVAVTDIGQVRFTTNSRLHEVVSDGGAEIASKDYISGFHDLSDVEAEVRQFSLDVLGNPDASLTGNQFSLGLPTTLHLQVDYHVNDVVYVNATVVQGLPLNNRSAGMGSILALTPRWEQRWFGAALPLSVYNGQEFRLGVAMRLGFLTIGTDDIGTLLQQDKLNGGDGYFAIKVSPLLFSRADRSQKARPARTKNVGPGKEPGCYRF